MTKKDYNVVNLSMDGLDISAGVPMYFIDEYNLGTILNVQSIKTKLRTVGLLKSSVSDEVQIPRIDSYDVMLGYCGGESLEGH